MYVEDKGGNESDDAVVIGMIVHVFSWELQRENSRDCSLQPILNVSKKYIFRFTLA